MTKLGKSILQKLMVLCLACAVTFAMCAAVFGNDADWSFTKGPYQIAGNEAVGSPEMNYDSVPAATVKFTVTSVTSPGTAQIVAVRKNTGLGALFNKYSLVDKKEIPITSGSAGKIYTTSVMGDEPGDYTFAVKPDGHSLNMKVNNVYISVKY